MEIFRRQDFFLLLVFVMVLAAGIFFIFSGKIYRQPEASNGNILTTATDSATDVSSLPPPPQKLSNPPEIVKAVYATGYSAGSKKYLNYLSNLFKTTEINAVVIDIKDHSGLVSYKSEASQVKKYNLYNDAISDIDALVRFFHDKKIYVIGRIVVFEDPAYSKARPDLAVYDKIGTADLSKPVLWQDNHGLSWLDPASKEVWDYNIFLAKNIFYHGFDEVNFDYVRFPSDGKTENMGFPFWNGKTPKAEVMKGFFNYIRQKLSGHKISVDLFGQTTVDTRDMGIGQLIENAFENFDYISPMVYPSHYTDGFMGFTNPAEHPYEVVKYSMDSAISRLPLAKFRPWLQDFNMEAYYTADMVKQEIKAVEDALGEEFWGFMLWNPSNIYTKEAILKPD